MSPNPFPISDSHPPWELLLDLLANKLDPKSLATSSCVSKTWSSSLSSDHLWAPICAVHFPSIAGLHPAITYRRIYSLGHSSAKRRLQPPPKPIISLDDIAFVVTIIKSKKSVTITAPCSKLIEEEQSDEIFRFDIEVTDRENCDEIVLDDDDLKVTCNVVLKVYEGVFTLLDRKRRGSRDEWWFAEELPYPAGCCFTGGIGGLVAELRLGYCEIGEKKVVETVRVGVMNVVCWRYATVEDTLRYLQHFLLDCHV